MAEMNPTELRPRLDPVPTPETFVYPEVAEWMAEVANALQGVGVLETKHGTFRVKLPLEITYDHGDTGMRLTYFDDEIVLHFGD